MDSYENQVLAASFSPSLSGQVTNPPLHQIDTPQTTATVGMLTIAKESYKLILAQVHAVAYELTKTLSLVITPQVFHPKRRTLLCHILSGFLSFNLNPSPLQLYIPSTTLALSLSFCRLLGS